MSEHRLGAAEIRFAFLIEPPFCYRASDGAVTGCDVEVARHCLHAVGVETIVFLETEFPELLPGLADGRWDMTTGLFAGDSPISAVRFGRCLTGSSFVRTTRTKSSDMGHSREHARCGWPWCGIKFSMEPLFAWA
jgi:ABC-type amino acid transport substrate-binding protein